LQGPSSIFFLINDEECSDSELRGTIALTAVFVSLCFRLLWEEEDEEEKLNEVETETPNVKTEEHNKSSDAVKRLQPKAPPCCPHLFMHQKPRLDVSYDVDRS
jgi:hypothetical protein